MNRGAGFHSRRMFSHISLIGAVLLTTLMPVGLAVLTVSPVQAAGPAWYDGLIQYSTITNCVSIIQGAPYNEYGAGTYVGFYADPDAGQPSPNTIYYIHVVVAGMGNACSGMRAYIDLGLPVNTTLANDTTNKVRCYYDNSAMPEAECPQNLPSSTYNPGMYWIPSIDSANAYTWPIPQGHFLEIQVPVRSTTQLTNSTLRAKVWMLDGNSSPWLNPQQGVYVFSNTPSILYPSPSTTSIQSTTAHSSAYLYTHGLGGTGYFDLGTDTNYGLIHESVSISAGGNAFMAWDDWGPPPLLPDTLYHWRFSFTYSGGTIFGADQTFRTLPNGVATVGSGATGSCTETALINALAAANQVKFSCGPLPVTITLTSARSITANVSIDGGNMVTLATNGSSNHFTIQSGGHLTLNKIVLTNGVASSCGGSIHVLANGQLTLSETRFENNTTTAPGGAVCIESNATADIHNSSFTNNHSTAGSGGGGVYNAGTLTLDHSLFTGNTAAAHGGGLQNYGSGTVTATGFKQNTAGINGGGIDAISSLTVNQGTFTGNTAGVRGGGINEYTGTLTVTESSFSGNHSNGYGGGVVNDVGTVNIYTSVFSNNSAASVGGGLHGNGTTTVTNSTFAGNQAGTNGGGIENSDPAATLVLLNTTLSNNSAAGTGGNLYRGSNAAAHLTLKNTLIATGNPNNCDGAVSSQGHNLESTNTCGLAAAGDLINKTPSLGPLHNNGGPTLTLALIPGSPAIDAGTNSGCPATDERGFARPYDGNHDGTATCDIGAYEYDGSGVKIFIPLTIR